jgi:phage tail-like protein
MSDTPPEGGADFSNAGEDPSDSEPTNLSADFSNAGEGTYQPVATALQADWGNAGLGHDQTDPTDLNSDWGNVGLRFTPPPSTTLMAPPAQAGLRYNTNIAISVFFTVTIDTVDLGSWSKCTGLGMSISYDERNESNMSYLQHHLPGHLVYDKITLERPLTRDCQAVLSWFSSFHLIPIPTSAQITCVDQAGALLMSWELTGVTPHTWKGPTLDATAGTAVAATEQLTFHHQGFL